jgi:hypothetical protein
MKQQGWCPLLIARGGAEAHGAEVLSTIDAHGLSRTDRQWHTPGPRGLLDALQDLDAADVVNLRSHVDADGRRVLFRGSDAVLANSAHEPFGLVGLETMAVGGIACTGCSGEDYALPGQNALVLQTGHPEEFLRMFQRLRAHPDQEQALRRAARSTAERFAWPHVIERILMPRLDVLHETPCSPSAARGSTPEKIRGAPPSPAAAGGAPLPAREDLRGRFEICARSTPSSNGEDSVDLLRHRVRKHLRLPQQPA